MDKKTIAEQHSASGHPDHVSFANQESFPESQDQRRPSRYSESSQSLHRHHHHNPQHQHHKWKKVCTIVVSLITIVLLAITIGAMYFLKTKVDIFPTKFGSWADMLILFFSPFGIFVFFLFLCIAGCCHDFFRNGPIPARWMILILFDILLLGVITINAFTLYTLVDINPDNIYEYTWEYGNNQTQIEDIWPRYIPKLHLVTNCSKSVPVDEEFTDLAVQKALKDCAEAYKSLLDLQPPKSLDNEFSDRMDKLLPRNETVRTAIKAEGKLYIYTIYVAWLTLMISTGLLTLISVVTFFLFNMYVCKYIRHHRVHPKKKKKKKKKTGDPNESSSSSESYSDSLDEDIKADKDDKRRAIKRHILQGNEDDSLTSIIRKQSIANSPELAERLAEAQKEAQGKTGQDINAGAGGVGGTGVGTTPSAQSDLYSGQQGQGFQPGFDPRLDPRLNPHFYGHAPVQPQAGPQIHFIQLPGGGVAPAPAAAAPPQQATPQNVTVTPQITINRSRRRVGDDYDDDSGSDDGDRKKKKKKKKKKGKKKKKKKSKKKKKKKKKGKKKKKKK